MLYDIKLALKCELRCIQSFLRKLNFFGKEKKHISLFWMYLESRKARIVYVFYGRQAYFEKEKKRNNK